MENESECVWVEGVSVKSVRRGGFERHVFFSQASVIAPFLGAVEIFGRKMENWSADVINYTENVLNKDFFAVLMNFRYFYQNLKVFIMSFA